MHFASSETCLASQLSLELRPNTKGKYQDVGVYCNVCASLNSHILLRTQSNEHVPVSGGSTFLLRSGLSIGATSARYDGQVGKR